MFKGEIWTKLLYVLAIELDLVDTAIRNLTKNLIPGLADELIDEWEEVLALPSPGTPLGLTLAERKNIAYAKYVTNYNGLSKSFFISYAANMGSTIEINEDFGGSECFRVDHARVDRTPDQGIDGARLWSLGVRHMWEVLIPATDTNKDILHDIFEDIKPAHTQLIWTEV